MEAAKPSADPLVEVDVSRRTNDSEVTERTDVQTYDVSKCTDSSEVTDCAEMSHRRKRVSKRCASRTRVCERTFEQPVMGEADSTVVSTTATNPSEVLSVKSKCPIRKSVRFSDVSDVVMLVMLVM